MITTCLAAGGAAKSAMTCCFLRAQYVSLKAVEERVAPLAGQETYDREFIFDLLLAYGKPRGSSKEARQCLGHRRFRRLESYIA